MKEALLYKSIKGNKVQCIACNHYCLIKEGDAGTCGIRVNKGGKLYLLTYGKPMAANIDPIEKKPLFHFLPGSQIFSVGTAGCNFGCDFCQNWQMSQLAKGGIIKDGVELENILENSKNLMPKEIIKIAEENKIPSVAYTYNEPTVFFEYAYQTALLAREQGIKNIFVSNGFMSKEARSLLIKVLDGINIDLKSFSDKFYKKYCKAWLAPVLENIEKFKEAGVWVEVTTLLIPGENDSDKEIAQIAGFLAKIDKSIPWHLSRFHPDYQMLDYQATSQESLIKAYEIAKNEGLNHVYIGNWSSEKYESTYCHNCDSVVIKRSGFTTENYLKKGKCRKCHIRIAGLWEK